MRLNKDDHADAVRFKAAYTTLRVELTPKQICESIARAEDTWPERVRMLISYNERRVICQRCWQECDRCKYGYVLCDPCAVKYRREKNHARYAKRVTASEPLWQRRHMNQDELHAYARRSLGMSAAEFGEALADVVVRPQYERRH